MSYDVAVRVIVYSVEADSPEEASKLVEAWIDSAGGGLPALAFPCAQIDAVEESA